MRPTESLDTDVIVAGAGIAGSTLALALKAAGLTPLLIDHQTFETQTAPAFDGRASAISFSCFRQWRAIGAAAAIEPHAQPIEQILVTDGAAPGAASSFALPAFMRFDSGEIAERSEGEPLGYMVENRHIRAGLAAAIQGAGIEVLAPARIESLQVEADGATVRLQGGERRGAPLVVGADGRESLIRRQSGVDTIGWAYRQVGVVATVQMSDDHGGVAHEHFLPSGPFAILPLTGGRASLVWTEARERGEALKSARDEVFEAHLRRRFGDFLGSVSLTGPRFVYPLDLQLASSMIAPRVALLGDAAHVIHPIAGQGLNLGLKDVAALAQVLSDAARLGEDIGSAAVLQRYERWRRFDTVALSLATDAFNRLFSTDIAPVRALRDAGLAIVSRIGPARRFFMEEAGGATGDLPRLLRGEAL